MPAREIGGSGQTGRNEKTPPYGQARQGVSLPRRSLSACWGLSYIRKSPNLADCD